MAETIDNISNIGSLQCLIDVLNTDVLLVVFSFLTLAERLNAMSVSKKWNCLLKDRTAWRIIDFTEECCKSSPVHAIARDKQKPTFKQPRTEKMVLDFLQQYASGSLKEIYLSVFSTKIMNFLRKTCPNLTVMSFLRATYLSVNSSVGFSDVEKKFYIPAGLQQCALRSWPVWTHDYGGDKRAKRDEKILVMLGRCSQLHKLTLHSFTLTLSGMQALTSKNKAFQEINLAYPTSTTEVFGYHNESLDNVLASSIGKLETLQCFRIDGCATEPKLPRFLSRISQWKHLTALVLRWAGCTTSFKSMFPGISNLQSLQLEGNCIVTTAVINSIGQNLKKLKFLELGNGDYSDDSLRTLLNHATLERVWIHQDSQSSLHASWLDAIYDVLVTLPNIIHVRIKGYRLLHLHATGQFPKLGAMVTFEIENADEAVVFD